MPPTALVVNGLDPSPLRVEYLDLLKAGGVGCWHRSVGGLQDLAFTLRFCDEHKTRIAPARSVDEIRRLHHQGRIAHVAGWQSAERLLIDGTREGPAIDHLRAYHELGLRICGIAYNVANGFGAGCLEPHIGLTRAGHRLVEEIHSLRILLDVGGHTNELTSFDALALSAGVPVICSHTNLRALNDNPRCSTDALLEAIARTGGVIGVSAFNDFHARTRNDANVSRTPQVDLDRHLDQYDYLKRLVGVDHIGLGPDFIEGRNAPGWVSPSDRSVMAPEAYSQQMPWFYVKGFENIGQLPNVAAGLVSRGWSSVDVRKVLGENWLRVYQKVWGA
ncbi:dipeptidase [Steroidobacter sp.]|uniref:dipeptidase n=1 Tax=Steroidobacter sp. TaxID=1978227 RepID=UPI001A62C337|nr:membrane dipeptidase [Steroidobacter sp.]MBL8271615.1 membrane dipeptidase [Steroidobacter sp.]